jgi:hypothetical protein
VKAEILAPGISSAALGAGEGMTTCAPAPIANRIDRWRPAGANRGVKAKKRVKKVKKIFVSATIFVTGALVDACYMWSRSSLIDLTKKGGYHAHG